LNCESRGASATCSTVAYWECPTNQSTTATWSSSTLAISTTRFGLNARRTNEARHPSSQGKESFFVPLPPSAKASLGSFSRANALKFGHSFVKVWLRFDCSLEDRLSEVELGSVRRGTDNSSTV